MLNRFSKMVVLAAAAVLFPVAQSAQATLLTGPGGSGVKVGQSSLIGTPDYGDTFTGTDDGGQAGRPYIAALQPAAAYVVENTFGHPTQNFQSATTGSGIAEWSIASDGAGHVGTEFPAYPGSSGAGSASGFTQTGGNVDYGLNFGLRTKYIVQADVVTPNDRVDITSGPIRGTIGQANAISVFFRSTGGISLYNTTNGDHPVPGFDTGLRTAGKWHNYAVLFDQDNQMLQLFVDEQSKGTVNLATFDGGIFQGFSNAAVGVGEGLGISPPPPPQFSDNRAWTDNFQVGSVAVPEPMSLGALGIAGLMLLSRRRRA